MNKSTAVLSSLFLACVLWVGASGGAMAQEADFCADMDAFIAEYEENVASIGEHVFSSEELERGRALACATADINGAPDGGTVTPNGMLDGEYELGLVAHLLNNPAIDLSSGTAAGQVAAGVRAEDIEAGFEANSEILLELWEMIDTGVILPPGMPPLLTHLFRVMSGYAIVGDADSVTTLGLYLGELFLVAGIEDLPSFEGFPGLLGPAGDADGDGFTNRMEYEAFAAAGGAAGYIAAALDPTTVPTVVPPRISGRSLIEVGESLTLVADMPFFVGEAVYAWTLNGQPLAGADGPTVTIPAVTNADAGVYRVTVTDQAAKLMYTSPPFTLIVAAEGSVPVGTPLGLALAAGVLALAGLRTIRMPRKH